MAEAFLLAGIPSEVIKCIPNPISSRRGYWTNRLALSGWEG